MIILWGQKTSQCSAWPTLGTYWDVANGWTETQAGQEEPLAGVTAETRSGDTDFIYGYAYLDNQFATEDSFGSQIDRYGFFQVFGDGTLSVDAVYTVEIFLDYDVGIYESLWAHAVVYTDLGYWDEITGEYVNLATDNQANCRSTLFEENGFYEYTGTLHIEAEYSDLVRGGFNISAQAGMHGVLPFHPVVIDIKPGSYPNCFNINGKGLIPVAINGSTDFNVYEVDVSSLHFAGLDVRIKGTEEPQCAFEDWNEDGYSDLVCHFIDNPDNWSPDDGSATLTGELLDGTFIEGTDSICIVP